MFLRNIVFTVQLIMWISFSGFFAFVTSILAFCAALYFKVPVTKAYDKFFQLMTSAFLFSFALAVFLYIKAKLAPENKIAPGGNTGRFLYSCIQDCRNYKIPRTSIKQTDFTCTNTKLLVQKKSQCDLFWQRWLDLSSVRTSSSKVLLLTEEQIWKHILWLFVTIASVRKF